MTQQFAPHFEILPPAQRQLWPLLSPLAHLDFVLYGGTAIALRYGHRQSVDFDFFSHHALDQPQLVQACPWLATCTTLQEAPNTWTVLHRCTEGSEQYVKVSFFGGITFGRVGTPDWTNDRCVHVASAVDLLATKLKVILQRIEAKDYIDIATLCDNGRTLTEGLSAARVMYGPNFSPSESLKALTFFEGGDLSTLPARVTTTLRTLATATTAIPPLELRATTLT